MAAAIKRKGARAAAHTAEEPPFKKILVANRGEIALRVILACKELGIQTVAVYSEADRNALHVRFADEEVCIGPAPSSRSYLNIPQVIAAAEVTGAEAIHPGYGFLSENPHFVEVCTACGINFIGPNAEIIRRMGNKAEAKATMQAAGIPQMPGSDGLVHTVEDALATAERIGYPVIVKASAGGGGRGMRICNTPEELPDLYGTARSEAKGAFGDDSVYMEKYLLEPRHIEVQILGDLFGNVVHLGERECSIQRRHQKLIEESPSAALSPDLRKRICETAVKAARAVGYYNAGTIEFLLDKRGDFYFMEMNTRVQVEHPVTELVTGIDIVKEQLRVAAGRRLSFTQDQVIQRGHAIECRINAEDPFKFTPSPGRITALNFPGGPGIRVDSAMHQDATIPPHYDSMIAKLIAFGADRTEAIARMRRALDTLVVEGVKTTAPLHRRMLDHADFISGAFSTKWLEGAMESLKQPGGTGG
ncbi:MAG: acetyl-CoA carboxylase biotin carboxylase subunit [Acidobacteria bacterium]|nr:acetyl-CoA carboxylase biotin carboxylase subunit [Acidobacteriota bacterium]